MVEEPQLPQETCTPDLAGASSPRALKNFRYVVASVNEDALRTWAELWKELDQAVTPSGLLGSELDEGGTPACGWPEFLERLWLLKHYLDYTRRLCQEAGE